MIALEELTRFLDSYLDPTQMDDFCPNGLQVEGKKMVSTLATAVSANLETIERAVDEGIDALIVHHGLFWNRDKYQVVGSKQKKLKALLDHEISLLSYHLPLDAHQEVGNNWRAAKDLGWQNLDVFSVGVEGRFKPVSIETFVQQMEKFYGHPAVTSLGGKSTVESAALISGGAYKEIMAAAKAGVDCFITGNFDEPAWSMAREEGINFLALGHSATERIGPLALSSYLEQHFQLPCPFLDIKNPF